MKLHAAHSKTQITTIAKLAEVIWNEHFPAIIGQRQVDYMLEKFQSHQAIDDQISKGYDYFLIEHNQQMVGYIAIMIDQAHAHMQLSKFYILPHARRQGVGSETIKQLIKMAHTQHIHTIWLTVNKYNNDAINAYYKMGFLNSEEVVTDIGQGFIMDDYRMELTI